MGSCSLPVLKASSSLALSANQQPTDVKDGREAQPGDHRGQGEGVGGLQRCHERRQGRNQLGIFQLHGKQDRSEVKGKEFADFKAHFTPDDRGFGYIKIMTGDELSKRSKFVFVTWIGPNVSVMKKAKMGTDKAFVKEVIQNISVELQPEGLNEV